jgi:hypothetical protein
MGVNGGKKDDSAASSGLEVSIHNLALLLIAFTPFLLDGPPVSGTSGLFTASAH